MSDTPKTDQVTWYTPEDQQGLVPAPFARTLERENAALLKKLDVIQKSHFSLSKDNVALRTALKKVRATLCRDIPDLYSQGCVDEAAEKCDAIIDAAIDAARKEAKP